MAKKRAKTARTPKRGPKSAATRRAKTSKRSERQADGDENMSLRRFLAASGLDSRRNCDEYIQQERITVDGTVVTEPSTLVNPSKQRICVDGERAKLEPKRYFLLNKPKGYLCTNADPHGRRHAVDLVTVPHLRLFTVGRLDENSEGLILVTNDGDLANKLAHPRYQVRRKYKVHVAGIPRKQTLDDLKRGLHFKEGRFRLHGAKRLKTQGKSSFLELEMREGQNREIRRLMARVGHKVMQLQRIEFGPLKLGRIASGKFRPLKPPEIKALRVFVDELEEQPRTRSNPRRHKPTKKTADAASETKPRSKPAKKSPAKPKAKTRTTKASSRKPKTGKKAAKGQKTATGKPKRKVGKKKKARRR